MIFFPVKFDFDEKRMKRLKISLILLVIINVFKETKNREKS